MAHKENAVSQDAQIVSWISDSYCANFQTKGAALIQYLQVLLKYTPGVMIYHMFVSLYLWVIFTFDDNYSSDLLPPLQESSDDKEDSVVMEEYHNHSHNIRSYSRDIALIGMVK